MEIDPELEPLLNEDDLGEIEASANTIYVVWPNLTLALTNEAWRRFAFQNGADQTFLDRWAVGHSIESVCSGPGGDRFGQAISTALRDERVQTVTYACSSVEVFRLMQANIFPLGTQAVMLSHALVRETDHAAQGQYPHPPSDEYEDESGLIVMCSGCRRVRRPEAPDRWDWVPAFVDKMPENTSHGFCPACKSYWTSPVATPKRF